MPTDLPDACGDVRLSLDIAELSFRLRAGALGGRAVIVAAPGSVLSPRPASVEQRHTRTVSAAAATVAATRVRQSDPCRYVVAAGLAAPALGGIAVRQSQIAAGQMDLAGEATPRSTDQSAPAPRQRAAARQAVERGRQTAGDQADCQRPSREEPAWREHVHAAAEQAPDTSARGRISSDPQPTHTRAKGGRGTPPGPARNSSRRRRAGRCCRTGILLATSIAALVTGTAIEVLAEAIAPMLVPPTGPDQLIKVFDNLRTWLVGLLAALATLMLTFGGLRYLVAGGDPGEVQKAKGALKAAALGYGLAVLAPLFVNVLKNVVGG
jgi:hypothetical protein